MSKPFISLCPEITRANALNLMDWLEDDNVTRYLSDSRHVSRFIEQVIGRVQLPILTHLFNQGGRFFMAYDRHDAPVGFVRLIKTGTDCEIVLVIGDRDNWGRKLGASALHEGMKLAFFEMRAERLIAKIHSSNTRSIKAFLSCGFELDHESASLKTFTLSSERYLQQLHTQARSKASDICITEIDQNRLRNLVLMEYESDVVDLEHEIERATVVNPKQVERDVVTMNSQVLLHLDEREVAVDLVYPEDADSSAGKLSVFSEVGTAILGYREGDEIDWRMDDRTCHISIAKVLYQPEAAGDFHL